MRSVGFGEIALAGVTMGGASTSTFASGFGAPRSGFGRYAGFAPFGMGGAGGSGVTSGTGSGAGGSGAT